jgi:hypothetical protein
MYNRKTNLLANVVLVPRQTEKTKDKTLLYAQTFRDNALTDVTKSSSWPK